MHNLPEWTIDLISIMLWTSGAVLVASVAIFALSIREYFRQKRSVDPTVARLRERGAMHHLEQGHLIAENRDLKDRIRMLEAQQSGKLVKLGW